MLFGITFVKKNGEVRDILCMFKPKTWKGIPTTNGGSLNWNPTDRGYLHVWDCIKGGWRMVNLETIQSIRFGRKSYNFENFKHFSEFMLVMGKLQKIESEEKSGKTEIDYSEIVDEEGRLIFH
jgi:hypothetical protein